ncbi:MAG: hypothetical protein FWD61_03415 [Phycisphaerales bacterium]|nr:hypothetical protein [Phycisphaerales bacterium]
MTTDHAPIHQTLINMMPRLRRLVGAHFRNPHTFDNALQDILVYLLETGARTYRPDGKADLAGWLYGCAKMQLRTIHQTNKRRNRPDLPQHATAFSTVETSTTQEGDAGVEAILADRENYITDPLVERLTNALIAEPEKYLPGAQARLFRALLDNPDITMHELAAKLGYGSRNTVVQKIRLLYHRITALDLWEPQPLSNEALRQSAKGSKTQASQSKNQRAGSDDAMQQARQTEAAIHEMKKANALKASQLAAQYAHNRKVAI